MIIPGYIFFRVTNLIPVENIINLFAEIFDAERVGSLAVRLKQEVLFCHKTLERPFLGWGGYGRGWPVHPDTGMRIASRVDALWLIVYNTYGLLGITSLVSSMLIGPWSVLRSRTENIKIADSFALFPALLSLIVILFLIDCLANAMTNPVYIMISGALVSYYVNKKYIQQDGTN